MKSKEIFPIKKRIKKPFYEDDNLEDFYEFEEKYNLENKTEYVLMIDNYHKALTAAENEIELLRNQIEELQQKK